jgi:hypothetical protein
VLTSRMLTSVALVAWLGTACGTWAHPADNPDAGNKTEHAAALIGPNGGTLRLTAGTARGATLQIPAGALTKPVPITMRVTQAPTDLPQGVTAVGPAIDFGPEGQTFARPVTVTLPTTRAAEGMYTRPSRNGTWSKIPGARYDPDRRVVVAAVTHFTIDVGTVEYDPHSRPSTGFNPEAFPAVGYLLRQSLTTPEKTFELVKLCFANCTATLIHPRVAITAAHCFDNLKGGEEFAIGFGNVCEEDKDTLAQIETCSDPDHQKILPPNTSIVVNPIKKYASIYRVSKAVISKLKGDEPFDVAILLLENSITGPENLVNSMFRWTNTELPDEGMVGTLKNTNQRVLLGNVIAYAGGNERWRFDEMLLLGQRHELGYLRSPDSDLRPFPPEGGSGAPFFYLVQDGKYAVLWAIFHGGQGPIRYNTYSSTFDHFSYINTVMDGLLKDHPDPDCSEFVVVFIQ